MNIGQDKPQSGALQESDRRWRVTGYFREAGILKLAKGFFIAVAIACILAMIVAFAVIVFLQAKILVPVSQETVPKQVTLPLPAPAGPVALDISLIERRLKGPGQVTLEVLGPFEDVRDSMPVAILKAESAGSIAPHPRAFVILGGPHAHFFKTMPSREGVLLAATERLAEGVNILLGGDADTGPTEKTLDFSIRMAARDIYDVVSTPSEIQFALTFLRKRNEVSPPRPVTLSPYQEFAREIALNLDPQRTPKYFAAYKEALAFPAKCGVSRDDDAFLQDAKLAFASLKTQLTPSRMAPFYDGLCDAWKRARAEENSLAAKAQGRRLAKLRELERRRNEIIGRNAMAVAKARFSDAAARLGQLSSLWVLGGAVVAFMFVALLLAFLAMESHSRSIRAAVNSISGRGAEDGGE